MPTDDATDIDTRTAVLDAAAELVAKGGTGALTTRAVATKASIQPPTLYRIFGDKRGLLAALAQDRLARFVKEKEADAPHPDPVEDLRNGWDRYVAFGLENPERAQVCCAIQHPGGSHGLIKTKPVVARLLAGLRCQPCAGPVDGFENRNLHASVLTVLVWNEK